MNGPESRSRRRLLRLVALASILPPGLPAAEEDAGSRARAFALEAEERILPRPSVRGDDEDWFFLVKELRHLATGKFWEKPWEEVAANKTDPVNSIVEFKEMLAERGIDLLLVPVPAKASVYPDKLSSEFAPGDVQSLAPFLERIRKEGVSVLDLESKFLAERRDGEDARLYCRQDAHFSPLAAERVAERVAAELGLAEGNGDGVFTVSEPTIVNIVGDQVVGSEWEDKVATEPLRVRQVLADGRPGVEPDDDSPVLLLGDSHALVFHEGREAGMHCTGAGVFDHLSFRLGFSLALVGVRGSGLIQARKQLFYKAAGTRGFWDGKKAVVWIFSVREFTQSTDRVVGIPLDRE
ncbi:MAG: hypothetical protein WD342_18665 [Verrucomicrobiales bacterium]